MLTFTTELPIDNRHDATEFIRCTKGWILASPHTNFRESDLSEIESLDEWRGENGIEHIELVRVEHSGEENAAVRYVQEKRSLQWTTTIVFSRNASNSWVGVQVSCESLHPSAKLPTGKKPVLVRTLLEKLGGAKDGILTVKSSPYRLHDTDIELAAQCITGAAGCRLPIVYASAPFSGGERVDVDALASSLSGMAHVLVEPNRAFSARLKFEVAAQNVYGGNVGIYWPHEGGRDSFFIGPEYRSFAEIEAAIFDEIRTALTNRRPQHRCTWFAVQEAQSRRAINRLKQQGSQDVEAYISAFDAELKAKEENLSEAEKEILRLQAEVRRLEARNPIASALSLNAGKEEDLYPGEIRQFVIETFNEALTRAIPDSRRLHVLTSIVDANPCAKPEESKREKLKRALREYRSMDARVRRALEELGFTIEEDGKHFKLVFCGDDRYTFSLPKSGSDHRGGLNSVSQISTRIF